MFEYRFFFFQMIPSESKKNKIILNKKEATENGDKI